MKHYQYDIAEEDNGKMALFVVRYDDETKKYESWSSGRQEWRENPKIAHYFHGLDTAELIDCTEEEAMELIALQENSNKS